MGRCEGLSGFAEGDGESKKEEKGQKSGQNASIFLHSEKSFPMPGRKLEHGDMF